MAQAVSRNAASRAVLVFISPLKPNILSHVDQIAQEAADALEHTAGRARIFLGGRRISSLVKPGLTSASRARAVHQLGAVASRPRRAGFGIGDLGFVGRAESLRIPDPESLRIPNPESRIPASVRRRAAGGTSVRSDRCRTSDTSLAGSTLACGLNFKTTMRPSRSIVSTPSRSAITRMRP